VLSYKSKKALFFVLVLLNVHVVFSINRKKNEICKKEKKGILVEYISMQKHLKNAETDEFIERFVDFLDEAQNEAEKKEKVKNFLHAIITSKKYNELKRKYAVRLVTNLVGVYLGDYFKKGIMNCVAPDAPDSGCPGIYKESSELIDQESNGSRGFGSSLYRSKLALSDYPRTILKEKLPVAEELKRKKLETKESFDIIKFLIEHGVNIYIRDSFGKNLLDYFKEFEFEDSERKKRKKEILRLINKRSDQIFQREDRKAKKHFLQNNDLVKEGNGDFEVDMPNSNIVMPKMFLFMDTFKDKEMFHEIKQKQCLGRGCEQKKRKWTRRMSPVSPMLDPGEGLPRSDRKAKMLSEKKLEKYNLAKLLYEGNKKKFLREFVARFKNDESIKRNLLHGIIFCKKYNEKEKVNMMGMVLSLLESYFGEKYKMLFLNNLSKANYYDDDGKQRLVGTTPLILALRLKYYDIARLLKEEEGIDCLVKDGEGKSASDYNDREFLAHLASKKKTITI